MRLWGCIRVSTKRQKVEGDSTEAQAAMIRHWCEMHGHDLLGFVEDVGSATRNILQRPGMEKLMGIAVAGGADGFICYKLDRMFRNTIEGLQVADSFTRLGFSMFFADLGGNAADVTTARGRRIFAYDLIDAEVESMRIGERVKAVSEDKKARGKQHTAIAPFGWHFKNGETLPHKKEQQALRLIWQCSYLLGMGPQAVADKLSQSPFPTRNKRKIWNRSSIAQILGNSINTTLFDTWKNEHKAEFSDAVATAATGKCKENSHV